MADDLYYEVTEMLRPYHETLWAAQFHLSRLPGVKRVYRGDREPSLYYPDHGLEFRVAGWGVADVYVHPPEKQEIPVYRAYSGGFAIPGPHWEYMRAVFLPWLHQVVSAGQVADQKERQRKEAQAQQEQENALEAWAAARGPRRRVVREPSLDDHWRDLKR